jgi:hypothetical protein
MKLSFPIVEVWISAGTTQAVGDVVKAAEVLLKHWPDDFTETDLYRAARLACLEAWEDDGDLLVARAAFVDAAREAAILAE